MLERNGIVITEGNQYLNEFGSYVSSLEDAQIFRTRQAANKSRKKSEGQKLKMVIVLVSSNMDWMTNYN